MLSVVISVYNEEGTLVKLYAEIKKSIDGLIKKRRIDDYEILFASGVLQLMPY